MPGSPDHHPLLSRLTTLTDPARLRMLRLLDRQELSVGELARALQLPQSTVSRHLKLLHDDHWTVKRSEGTASLYRLSEAALSPERRELWTLARQQLHRPPLAPTYHHDDARLDEVIASRQTDSRSFFRRLADDDDTGAGGAWDALRRDLYGDWFTAEALLGLIPAHWTAADLGCGTGNATAMLAPLVRTVIAIDREPAMLQAARLRLKQHDNIEFMHGDLSDLPLRTGQVDAALLFLVLAHVDDPAAAVREAGRILKSGGTLLIVDVTPHDRESYRHTMGHRHLGFSPQTVQSWATAPPSAALKPDSMQGKRSGPQKKKTSAQSGNDSGFDPSSVHYRLLRPNTTSKGPPLFVGVLRKA